MPELENTEIQERSKERVPMMHVWSAEIAIGVRRQIHYGGWWENVHIRIVAPIAPP